MVLKTNSLPFTKRGSGVGMGFAIPASRTLTPRTVTSRTPQAYAPPSHSQKSPITRRTTGPIPPDYLVVSGGSALEAEDVIDLGAPRHPYPTPANRMGLAQAPRKRRPYTPNPRLYPGPAPGGRAKRKERSSAEGARRQKRVFRRPVPNSRLYRPAPRVPAAPPSPPPVASRPRAAWPPPVAPHSLDTASHVALHLAERRRQSASSQGLAHGGGGGGAARRLVVRLPAAGDAPRAGHALYRRLRCPDRSNSNNIASVTNDFLAEFLSAIMQRHYAEALKYCRLILQYEPQNATARNFQPLLQQKLLKHHPTKEDLSAEERSLLRGRTKKDEQDLIPEESETESFGSYARLARSKRSHSRSRSEPSCAGQSSLGLVSSSCESGSPAGSSKPTECTSGASAVTVGWESSASRSEDDGDTKDPPVSACSADNHIIIPGETSCACASASLQRLRAQFACSVK